MTKALIKRILNCKFRVRIFFDPLISLKINRLKGLKTNPDKNGVIISLTSYPERFENLPKTLYSLFTQTIPPERIILWLDKKIEGKVPDKINKFKGNGLEIRFVEDIKSYTKLYYALKEFSDSAIVTADDDIYYPPYWLERLYKSYTENPEDIQVHRAHKVILKEGGIAPYESWEKHTNEESADYLNFLTGVGGVLYPPKCFINEVFNKDIFLKASPNADDIWFWLMAVLSGRKIRVVKNHIKYLISTNLLLRPYKQSLYNSNSTGGNDIQLRNLLKLYGEKFEKIISTASDSN